MLNQQALAVFRLPEPVVERRKGGVEAAGRGFVVNARFRSEATLRFWIDWRILRAPKARVKREEKFTRRVRFNIRCNSFHDSLPRAW